MNIKKSVDFPQIRGFCHCLTGFFSRACISLVKLSKNRHGNEQIQCNRNLLRIYIEKNIYIKTIYKFIYIYIRANY